MESTRCGCCSGTTPHTKIILCVRRSGLVCFSNAARTTLPQSRTMRRRSRRWNTRRAPHSAESARTPIESTALDGQHRPKSGINSGHGFCGQLAGSVSEQVSVYGNDLRHVRDRVLRKSTRSPCNENVSWCLEQPEIRCQYDGDRGFYAAAIERISLND